MTSAARFGGVWVSLFALLDCLWGTVFFGVVARLMGYRWYWAYAYFLDPLKSIQFLL